MVDLKVCYLVNTIVTQVNSSILTQVKINNFYLVKVIVIPELILKYVIFKYVSYI